METARAAVDAVRHAVWTRFIHPDTGMFYDIDVGAPGFPWLPTTAEIEAGYPNAAGWLTGMENCALNVGQTLPAALLRHRLAPDADTEAQARVLFEALLHLFDVARDPGFLPRGVGLDGVSHYPNSSADQYTMVLYALHAFARSDLATDADRQRIARVWNAVLTRWERDGWEDRREDGTEAWFGDMGRITPDRAGRLLAALLGGAVHTGEARWRQVYEEKRAEADGARLRTGLPPVGASLYVFDQNQVAWRLLWELEEDEALRRRYGDLLKETAAAVADRLPGYTRFDADEHARALAASDWDWRHACLPDGPNHGADYNARQRRQAPALLYEHERVQEPVEAAHILALSEDPAHHVLLRQHLPALLVAYPWDRVALSWSVYDVEWTWWAMTRRG